MVEKEDNGQRRVNRLAEGAKEGEIRKLIGPTN